MKHVWTALLVGALTINGYYTTKLVFWTRWVVKPYNEMMFHYTKCLHERAVGHSVDGFDRCEMSNRAYDEYMRSQQRYVDLFKL